MSDTTRPRISGPALVQVLGDDLHGPGAAFRVLASAIAQSVDRGDLPGATLLPPERALATALGMSRGTVVAAYEVLREDGVVLRRQGSGTWVRSATTNDGLVDTFEHDAARRARRLTARVVEPPRDLIDLGLSVLDRPWGLDQIDMHVSVAELTTAGGPHGYLPIGLSELRAAIAARFTDRGLATTIDQIAITHGAQQSIALAARLLVHPGDTVALESPTFPGAIDAFSRAGARFTTVAMDSCGAKVGDVERVLREDTRLLYLVASCHSVTGSVMAEHRRREIATLVDSSESWLIEDETLAPLCFGGPPPPPMAVHGSSDRHVTVGSLAKQVWAGLRVGWIRAEPTLISRLARLRAATDLGGSIHSQVVALRCLDGLDERTEALRAQVAERSAQLVRRITPELPEWSVDIPEGGLSVWCRL
ncbi:PLP-dependent aminotransferase family protein [soil metagenome]